MRKKMLLRYTSQNKVCEVFFMSNFLESIDLFEVIKLGIFLVCCFVVRGKPFNIKNFLEVCMKYRTSNFQDTEKVSGQKFNQYKPIYRLDKTTGNLVESGEFIDIQELTNSMLDTCLEQCLARFLPDQVDSVSNEIQENYSQSIDTLDLLRESFAVAETYRDKLGLDSSLSIGQVFEKVKEYSSGLKKRLDSIKGGKVDEKKKTDEESK